MHRTGDPVNAVENGRYLAEAIRCARAVRDSVGQIGVPIRIGLHTGECEVVADKLRGIAVHIGARVAATAAPARSSHPRRSGTWWLGRASTSRSGGRTS